MKKLSDMGERKAIDIVSAIFKTKDVAVGIGDDCAAIDIGEKYLLITTDMISQRTHIPKQMTPFQMGWFVVAINLSDIAAKGGVPIGLVLSFGLPKDTSEKFLKQLAEGANKCAIDFDTHIIGGDMKETSEITLCGTAFGTVKKKEFMSRKGIKADDILAVTGNLGKAGLGYFSIKLESHKNALSKHLFEPIPRLKEGIELAQQKCITSCMDISDGLSSSLYQLQKLNNVGFEVDLKMIPISKGLIGLKKKNRDIDIYKIALNFGGDYELLVTIPEIKFEEVEKNLRKIGCKLIAIGKATNENKIMVFDGNVKEPLENLGYEHFKKHLF